MEIKFEDEIEINVEPLCFAEKEITIRHERIHTQKKPYQCTICDKIFLYKGYLIRHMKIHTTREKSFKCSHCYRAFSENSRLTWHMRTQSEEKPYECRHCDKPFSRNFYSRYTSKDTHWDETISVQAL
ncbi:unnamed protein product [Meganyctiphanes norvegica]|uniref:C2H2-type domain-containing protein n=1 Tax=Meganyctiphanes norvegica TaxID=48144 RepID=A0AAV2R1R7_MEGNR